MYLLLLRHGKIKWNKIGFLSKTDLPLSSEGKRDVSKAGNWLKENFRNIEIIFTSPLKRCVETAKIISKIVGAPIEIAEELREIDFGIFEGLSKEEAREKYPLIYKEREKNKWSYRIPKGESYEDGEKRVKDFLSYLSKKEYECVLVVTHVTVIKIFLKILTKLSLKEIEENFFHPLSLSVLEKKNNCFRLMIFNKKLP